MNLLDSEFINNLPGLPKDFLTILRSAAQRSNTPRIAIVGGIVRDRLIQLIHKEPIQSFHDIDLVIEGSEENFAEELLKILGPKRVCFLRQSAVYQTLRLTIDGVIVDLASARSETYEFPAENPKILKSTIEGDIKRRDFSINAISLDLVNNIIIDTEKGIEAIKKRQLVLLHKDSIAEDPTRIIRAARYAARLNFNLDPESLMQIKSKVGLWPWHWIDSNLPNEAPPALSTRLSMELNLLFNKEPWVKAITNLQEWGALSLLDETLQKDKFWERRISLGNQLGTQLLTAFISGAKDPCSLSQRLQLHNSQINYLKQATDIKNYFLPIIESKEYLCWKPSRWCEEIEGKNWLPEAISLVICVETPLKVPLLKWLKEWRLITAEKSPKQLLEEGWEQGPSLGKELKRLRNIILDKDALT